MARSRNASGSIFGWAFQTAAGIYLFLKNIKHAESIKMEGEIQDIEIHLDDSTVIYAQAKSSSLEDPNNQIRQLKDALESLSECPENSSRLIYVTNHLDPLKSEAPGVYATLLTSFDGFMPSDQDKVRKYLTELGIKNFDTSKFQVLSLRFSGSEDLERYGQVKKAVDEFLDSAKVQGKGERALTEWRILFGGNNSKRYIKLNKKDVIFPLILVVIEGQVSEEKYTQVCSCGLYSEVMEKYDTLIKELPSNYSFFARVSGEYKQAHTISDVTAEGYVTEHWRDFEDEFRALISDDEERESFIKIVMMATIMKRSTLNHIKEAAGLE